MTFLTIKIIHGSLTYSSQSIQLVKVIIRWRVNCRFYGL